MDHFIFIVLIHEFYTQINFENKIIHSRNKMEDKYGTKLVLTTSSRKLWTSRGELTGRANGTRIEGPNTIPAHVGMHSGPI